MKKTIVSLAVMVIAAISVNAQQPYQSMKQHHNKEFRHHGRDRMAKKLNFSDQQKEQLKNINSDYHNKLTELKKHDEITVKEFKSKMDALHTTHRAQMQALLTAEQKDQLAKMKEEKMQLAKVNAGARAEKLKIKLGLTDAQASQLKNIRTDMAAKMKSIHTDNSLSREQKHDQIKALASQQKDQLKNILTADQLQQLEEMRKGAPQHRKRDFAR